MGNLNEQMEQQYIRRTWGQFGWAAAENTKNRRIFRKIPIAKHIAIERMMRRFHCTYKRARDEFDAALSEGHFAEFLSIKDNKETLYWPSRIDLENLNYWSPDNIRHGWNFGWERTCFKTH